MKKILSILLIAGMLSMLASCGKESGTEETTANATITESTTEVSSEFEPVAGADYGGYKFRMLGFESTAGNWKSVSYSEIYTEAENGDPINDALYKRNRVVEDLYNIEIDIVPISYTKRETVGAEARKSILAGDDRFDVGMIPGICTATLLGQPDMLVDLNTVPGLDLSKSWWDQNSVKDLSIGNKLFLAVGDMSLYTSTGTVVMFANKELIKNYALEDPYELVRSGKWTWDKLKEMCRVVASDLDGNSVLDENDQIGLLAEVPSLTLAFRSTGERLTSKDSNDLPVLTMMTDRAAEAVDKISSIINEKNVNLCINDLVGKYTEPFSQVAMPKFRDNQALFFYNQLLIALELRNMQADFAILPVPKFNEGQDKYYSNTSEFFTTYTIIPQTNTDNERTANILQALCYYSQQYVNPAFYDVTVTNKLIRDEGSLEMLDIIMSNRSYDLGVTFNWGGMTQIFEKIISSKNNDFVSAYEKAQGAIEKAMDKTLTSLDLK